MCCWFRGRRTCCPRPGRARGALVKMEDQRRDPLSALRRPALRRFSSTWLSSRAPSQVTSKASSGICRTGSRSCAAAAGTARHPSKPRSVLRGVEHRGLQPEQVAWSRKFKICRRPSGKFLEAERPARVQRIELGTCPRRRERSRLPAGRVRWSRLMISLMTASSFSLTGLNRPHARKAHSKQLTRMRTLSLFAAHGVLEAADGVLHLALDLVGLAFASPSSCLPGPCRSTPSPCPWPARRSLRCDLCRSLYSPENVWFGT